VQKIRGNLAMSLQKKLFPCFDKDFWKDPNQSISYLVRDLLVGRDISRVAGDLKAAGVKKCSDSLLYQWANPNQPDSRPSLYAFLLLIKVCEDCSPIDSINEACGKVGVPDDDFLAGVKYFAAEFEARQRLKGVQAGTPAPLA
jgi:hypothetical protein